MNKEKRRRRSKQKAKEVRMGCSKIKRKKVMSNAQR